jgi:hypothetical protein
MHGKGRHGDEGRTLVVAHFTLIFLINNPFDHIAIGVISGLSRERIELLPEDCI